MLRGIFLDAVLSGRGGHSQGVLHDDDQSDGRHQLAFITDEFAQDEAVQAHQEDQFRVADGARRDVHHGLHGSLHAPD